MRAYHDEVALARHIGREAGALQLRYQSQLPAVDRKGDGSPVSEVDRRCETLIREQLLDAFPSDGFLGEESGAVEGTSGRRWIVDPLDGTRPYLRGIPTYSVLIALEEGTTRVVGVMHFPALNEIYWASCGSGAFFNERPIRVSTTQELGKAMGSSLGFVEQATTAQGDALFKLMRSWEYAYGFMDAYTYASVACGRLDLAVNLLDKAWDCAAGACIVAEAGGAYSDIHGTPSVHNGSIILSNGRLHHSVVEWFLHT